MRIFVTGATGVIGRRVVPQLVRDGHEVTAIVRSADGASALERAGARPLHVDLFNPSALNRVMPGHDAVINLATHMPFSTLRMLIPRSWRENDRIRRDGSACLVDAALRAGIVRFLQESFAPAYPDCGSRWITEDTPLAPARYNMSLLDAERSTQRFASNGGAGVMLRFAAFYGPDAMQTQDTVRLVRKGWAPLPGAPDAYVSSVSHDDAASATVAALQVPAGAYNVVDDEPLTRREYFDALAQALDVPPPRLPPAWLKHVFGSTGELLARSQRMSNDKLRQATGWTPRHRSAREGWRELAATLEDADLSRAVD
jgi:nucleoside-diphosphate-sugar epimerase